MSQRLSLPTSFLDSARCIAAIDALHALFRKEYRRAPTVQLYASSFRDKHTITLYADQTEAQQAEVQWFTFNLAALYP